MPKPVDEREHFERLFHSLPKEQRDRIREIAKKKMEDFSRGDIAFEDAQDPGDDVENGDLPSSEEFEDRPREASLLKANLKWRSDFGNRLAAMEASMHAQRRKGAFSRDGIASEDARVPESDAWDAYLLGDEEFEDCPREASLLSADLEATRKGLSDVISRLAAVERDIQAKEGSLAELSDVSSRLAAVEREMQAKVGSLAELSDVSSRLAAVERDMQVLKIPGGEGSLRTSGRRARKPQSAAHSRR